MGCLKLWHVWSHIVIVVCIMVTAASGGETDTFSEETCHWDATKSFADNIHCVTRHKRQVLPDYAIYGHPCTSYTRLVQPERRVGNNINHLTDSALCDRTLRRHWYRFDGPAGGALPETCVQEYNCGTHAPIWLNGHHPAFYGETLDIPVCASLAGDCCARTWYIRVANCGDFFSYLLTHTPGCFMAYCAGIEEPCPPGQSSITGFSPGCSDNFPEMLGDVTLLVGEEGHHVAVYCDYDGPIPVSSVIETEWYVQGDNSGRGDEGEFPVFVESMRGRRRSKLQEGHWAGKMGSTIFCRMRAKWMNRTGVPSPFIASEKYFAGIKISKRVLSVSEAEEEAVISVQSTMPVVCLPQFQDTCKVTVELAHDPEVGGKQCLNGKMEQVVFGDCSIDITPSNWRDVHNVSVKAVRDFYNDGTKSMRVNFRPTFSTLTSELWNNYELPEVEVIAEDEQSALCSSTGDPHYNTFDGLYYHVYLEGEFVLYKNRRMPIQVNTRLEQCGKTVSCNCGVAVKAGDDVIVIDRCMRRKRNLAYGSSFPEGWRSLHRHALEQGDEFVDGLKIYEYDDGRRYTIHLPTGAYLDFRVGEHWVNIYVHASSDDWRSTLGLCGTFDDDRTNEMLFPDLVTMATAQSHEACGESEQVCKFAEAWRVKSEDSFFGPVVEVASDEHEFFSHKRYCKCEQENGRSTVVCNYHNDVHNCQAEEQKKRGVDRTNDVLIKSRSRFKRDLEVEWTDDDMADYFQTEFVYNRTFKGQVPQWPTPSGITQSYARTYCRDVITRTHAAHVCNNINDDKIDVIMDECITDIKVTDDLAWATASLATFTEECTTTIHEQASYWETSGSSDTDSSGQDESSYQASRGAALLTEVCPSDCSRHGTCYQGDCHCRYGYEGDDCSSLVFKAPEMQHLSEEGLCDISTRPCEKIKVHGKGFRNITDLQCHFRDEADQLTTSDAVFITFEEVYCPLPVTGVNARVAMATHALFITGNGYRSNERKVAVYDSRCYVCDTMGVTTTCSRQDGGCVIEGSCYGQGDSHPDDCCLTCDAERAADRFSKKEATRKISLYPHQTNYVTFVGDVWTMNFRAFGGSGCPFRYTTHTESRESLQWSEDPGDLKVALLTNDVGDYKFEIIAADPCGQNLTRGYTVSVNVNPSPTPDTGAVSCQGNIEPRFPSQAVTFYLVPKETLVVQLTAQHEYDDKLEYYVIKNTDNHISISENGLLRYLAGDELKAEILKVFAEDTCGQRGYMTVNIVIRRCACVNGGTCVLQATARAGSGVYDCLCQEGFRGQFCEESESYE